MLAKILCIALSACVACSRTTPGAASDAAAPRTNPPLELRLERALPIRAPKDFEPSGLVFWNGRLLTVSDAHDDAVYELELGADEAVAHVFRQIRVASGEPGPFDFEGIAVAPNGELLLVSESRYRVLGVSASGQSTWQSDSFQNVGLRAGLFRRRNAAFEGLSVLRDGSWLLCAEREPRGLIAATPGAKADTARAVSMAESAYPFPDGVAPDFADLSSIDGEVYVLERGARLIVRLEAVAGGYAEREAYSYALTETAERFRYEDMRYGRGEGLAFDQTHVYVVLDSNREARAGTADDYRSLLFVFRRPPRP